MKIRKIVINGVLMIVGLPVVLVAVLATSVYVLNKTQRHAHLRRPKA
jgi:hypothetical protein